MTVLTRIFFRRLLYLVTFLGTAIGFSVLMYGSVGKLREVDYKLIYATPEVSSCQEFLYFSGSTVQYHGNFKAFAFLDTNKTMLVSGLFIFDEQPSSLCNILGSANITIETYLDSTNTYLVQPIQATVWDIYIIIGAILLCICLFPGPIGHCALSDKQDYSSLN
jgi:hypothetical protein